MNQALIGLFDRVQRIALIVGIVGLALCLVGLFIDSATVMQSYLFAFFYWAGISLGSLAVLMILFTVKNKWGRSVQRFLEAGALTIPIMAALFIPILLGSRVLYPWARPEVVASDALLQEKSAYLNVPFFLIRAILFFAIWSALAFTLRRWSRQGDAERDPGLFQRFQNLSIFGLVIFTLTVTFAMIDWFMSLEPAWSSTIYGAMIAMGGLLAAFALALALAIQFRESEPLAGMITSKLLSDLGNLLFAGLLMWAYLAFSQYLVIWTGNLSDEIPWYLRRLERGWQFVALIIVALHFILPFVLLLSSSVKRSARLLGFVAVLLIVMHLIDAYWVVIPALRPNGFAFSWTDIVAPIGIGGLWVSAFVWQLKQSPLVPLHTEADEIQGATANG